MSQKRQVLFFFFIPVAFFAMPLMTEKEVFVWVYYIYWRQLGLR